MKRRVRPIAGLPIDKILAHARALDELLAPFDVALNVKDRNRRLKMPSKSADAIAPLLVLAEKFGLGAYAAPIEEHRSALAKLADLQVVLVSIQTMTSGLVMNSESETWKATTTVYSMLRRLSRSDGELAKLLRPIVLKYFARKKASPAEPAGPTAAPATVAPANVANVKKRKGRRRG